jgi:hypothetical protein
VRGVGRVGASNRVRRYSAAALHVKSTRVRGVAVRVLLRRAVRRGGSLAESGMIA